MKWATEKQVRMAAQMYDARDTARSFLGTEFPARMAQIAGKICDVAKQRGESEMTAMLHLAQQANGVGALCYIAAYVEMVEPSAAVPQSRDCTPTGEGGR